MLLTYSSLISAADSGASRLQQLVDWCKPGFDGLIVFDGMTHSWPSLNFDDFAPSYVLHHIRQHQASPVAAVICCKEKC